LGRTLTLTYLGGALAENHLSTVTDGQGRTL
jgi:hypothetical protein